MRALVDTLGLRASLVVRRLAPVRSWTLRTASMLFSSDHGHDHDHDHEHADEKVDAPRGRRTESKIV